jgi:hypothetical protein
MSDFALMCTEQGPAHIAQLVGMYSGNPVWVKVQLLGHVLDLADLLPSNQLRDEVCFPLIIYCKTYFFFQRHLFFTDEIEEVPLNNVLAPCYIPHYDLIFDMDL